ncbi:MAG TPA: hypothetical protein VFT09_12830 [Ilumatobacteraceae bacterium]|nr:hypothetical protein [Ilumatobacteraceae bacterium]
MTSTANAHLTLATPSTELATEPGDHTNVRLTLHNRSSHVDHVWIDVEGASAGWTGLHPHSLCLPPRRAGVAWLAVHPPVGTASGALRLSIRVRSAIDAAIEIDQAVTVLVAPAAEAA